MEMSGALILVCRLMLDCRATLGEEAKGRDDA